ncbi:MAG: hypothetical protein IPK59_12885 [Rhodospirillaceae bacterium]|nr:hypothetical protein [Rhodospirillaceae bacterium]
MFASPLAFRPTPTETAAMASISRAYAARFNIAFVNRSDVVRLALRAAARLAEEGTLFDALCGLHRPVEGIEMGPAVIPVMIAMAVASAAMTAMQARQQANDAAKQATAEAKAANKNVDTQYPAGPGNPFGPLPQL